MSVLAFAFVLLSAVLHTAWNALLKQSDDKDSASAALLLTATITGTIPALLHLYQDGRPPWQAVCLALTTSLLWLLYYRGLACSYERGDLSVAYPIARGVAPVATLLLGVLLLGERPSVAGICGIALVVLATWLISRPTGGGAKAVRPWAAVFVGLLTSGYSIVDKRGVTLAHPALYLWLCTALAAVWMHAYVLGTRGPQPLAAAWQRGGWRLAAAGVGDYMSYGLILLALKLAPVVYVVPLRATAVLFSVACGAWALGETPGTRRVLGALLMMVGILLVTWRG